MTSISDQCRWCRVAFQVTVDDEKSAAAFHRYDCWRQLHSHCRSEHVE